MARVFLIMGSDVGDKKRNLEKAASLLEKSAGKIVAGSHVYETEPWGFEHEDYFLNQVIEIKTGLKPHELLQQLHIVENTLGRMRAEVRYTPRTMDIDILFYDDKIMNTPELKIPHPEISNRRFVLEPLAEIAPDLIHPVLRKTVRELLIECRDTKKVNVLLK